MIVCALVHSNYYLKLIQHISEMFCQSLSRHFVLCSMEKTQSLISPYTCYMLCALCYGWLAAVSPTRARAPRSTLWTMG